MLPIFVKHSGHLVLRKNTWFTFFNVLDLIVRLLHMLFGESERKKERSKESNKEERERRERERERDRQTDRQTDRESKHSKHTNSPGVHSH